jgi:hypothetical protein
VSESKTKEAVKEPICSKLNISGMRLNQCEMEHKTTHCI